MYAANSGGFLFIGLFALSVSPLQTQGLGMIAPLKNQISEIGEAGAIQSV
jgi:hypothetical protein